MAEILVFFPPSLDFSFYLVWHYTHPKLLKSGMSAIETALLLIVEDVAWFNLAHVVTTGG